MPADNQTPSSSTDNFNAIFNTASNEYQKVTGKRLDTHPFSAQLDTCHTPEDILKLFQAQAEAFSESRLGDEKLMKWLDPTVHILFTLSATLGEGVGLPFSPAKTIFTGVGILLGAARDVVASHGLLVSLFERIYFFLQRLKRYTGMSLTKELKELLGKTMAELLSILALSTKSMSERGVKKLFKRLAGRTDVEDALSRLDTLTKEESLAVLSRNLEVTQHVDSVVRDVDGNVKATKTLIVDLGDNVKAIEKVTSGVDHNVKETKHDTRELMRNQLREKVRTWLSPPDPSINHNTACKAQHGGTARWFIQGNTFQEWKKNGSFLWIRGNPGVGKSILCSAIIEDIKNIRDGTAALITYYYFDFKDASKRDVHGLLTSLLFQLGDASASCWDALHELYTTCHDGSEQPSDAALAKCLRIMLELLGQVPVFLIIDALDECPSNTGTPSPREEVLDVVEDLIRSNHSNLFVCITSRPEQDIQVVLNSLTSASRRVTLHEESGQREDINSYVRSFIQKDRAMRRWREEDRELVIATLSERADGMFRWVVCQLDALRRCFPSSIRKTLDELPTTLDETYERTLEGIPKQKRSHAHRLFQCLVAAIRPLLVEELAEIFAIDFGPDAGPNLRVMEGWRPENAEEAVLSACSTLISVIDNQEGSKIVQFSHFSVKEFLTSGRLRTSEIGDIHYYHIPLDAAHTILARACITVLLQLNKEIDKLRLKTLPLVFYAAHHCIAHAKHGDVILQVRDIMEELFNPNKPYLSGWVWIYDINNSYGRSINDLPEHRMDPRETALYYAALCGFNGLAEHLIVAHGEDVNVKCGRYSTSLHAASHEGYPDIARLLLHHGADVNAKSSMDWTPLHWAATRGHAQIVQILLEHGADVNARTGYHKDTPLYRASTYGHLEVVRLLLRHEADERLRGKFNLSPFETATSNGHKAVAQLLSEYGAEND